MKKFFFVLVLLFIAIMTIPSFSEEEHFCPTEGTWEKNTIYKTYPGTNCVIKIEWCCYLDENGVAHYSNIFFSETDNDPDNCMAGINPTDLFNWVVSEIVKQREVCVPSLPPCDDPQQPPAQVFDVTNFSCYRYVNERHGVPGDYIYILKLVPCNSTTQCVTIYEECWDYAKNEKRVTQTGQYSIPGPNCASYPPLLPPQGKDWEEAWSTSCFSVGCP